jgi:hypothetical protein
MYEGAQVVVLHLPQHLLQLLLLHLSQTSMYEGTQLVVLHLLQHLLLLHLSQTTRVAAPECISGDPNFFIPDPESKRQQYPYSGSATKN